MIRVDAGGPIFAITLDRPDQRNALTPAMLEQVIAAVRSPAPGARAILIAGAGRVFCAGFDLTICRDDPSGGVMRRLLTELHGAVHALRASPLPVVIAAHGAAIAGGCAILGGGDVVVTNHEATIGYPVTRMGISPAVSAPFLRQGVGDGACRERMLDSGLISGQDALRIGLVHESVGDAGAVLERATLIAGNLAEKPGAAMAATKAWLATIAPTALHEAAALAVSVGLAGGGEEQARLAEFWSRQRSR